MVHDDIIALFTANGIGSSGVDFFWGSMPPDPDTLMAVYDSPGPGGLYTKSGPASSEARLQVLCRSPDYADAMQKALQVYVFLDNRRWTAGSVRYHSRPVQRPFDVGATDEADRTIISCNYELNIKAS